jgi:hypothetical protein
MVPVLNSIETDCACVGVGVANRTLNRNSRR